MSKEADIVNGVCEAIAAIADPAFGVEDKLKHPKDVPDRTVIVWPERLTFSESSGAVRRWWLTVLIVVRAKAVSGDVRPASQALDDVRAVLDAVRGDARLKTGGTLGLEQVKRSPVDYFGLLGSKAGGVAGGFTRLIAQWKE